MTGATGVKGPAGPAGLPGTLGAGLDSNTVLTLCKSLQCDQNCEVDNTELGPFAYCICTMGYIVVRLNSNLKCDTLNICDYDNGGCEQTCINFGNGTSVCECSDDYTLAEDKQSCLSDSIIGPSYRVGNQTSNVSVSCSINYGHCEQVCVSGNGNAPDHCACFSNGFTLTESGLNCLDVNECNFNPAPCPVNSYCLNTFGSYRCVTLTSSTAQNPQALLSSDQDLAQNATQLLAAEQSKFAPVAESASQLKAILFSMIGWIAFVTFALLVLVTVAYRHYRKDRRADDDDDLPDTLSSGGGLRSDAADLTDFENEAAAKRKTPDPDLGLLPPSPLYTNVPALVFSTPHYPSSVFSNISAHGDPISGGGVSTTTLRSPMRFRSGPTEERVDIADGSLYQQPF